MIAQREATPDAVEQVRELCETLLSYLPGPKQNRAYRGAQPGAVKVKTVGCPACNGTGGLCAACHGTGKVQVDPYTAEADEARRERKMSGEERKTMTTYELDRTLEQLERQRSDPWTEAAMSRDRAWARGSYPELCRVLDRMRKERPLGFDLLWRHVITGGYGIERSQKVNDLIRSQLEWVAERMPARIRTPVDPRLAKQSLWHGQTPAHQARRAGRDHTIRWLAKTGWSTKEIADRYGLSPSQVRRIKQGAEAE